jgi:hypothetical protein
MRYVLTYLRFHRQRVQALALIGALGVALGLLLGLRPTVGRVTLLGDTGAPPVHSGAVPAAYDVLPAVRPAYVPLQARVEARTQLATTSPSAEYGHALFTALSCARAESGRPDLTLDSQLSQDAAALWSALMREPGADIATLTRGQPFVAIVPLTLTQQPAEPDAYPAPASDGPCAFGGTDVAQLDLGEARAVGIAVFVDPHPDDGLDDTSAVIVAR